MAQPEQPNLASGHHGWSGSASTLIDTVSPCSQARSASRARRLASLAARPLGAHFRIGKKGVFNYPSLSMWDFGFFRPKTSPAGIDRTDRLECSLPSLTRLN